MPTTPPPTVRPPVNRSPTAGTRYRLRLRELARVPLPEASRETTSAPDHRARDWPFRRGLVIADLIAAAIGVGAALLFAPWARATPAIVLAGPLVVTLAMLAGLYRRDEMLIRKTTLDEAPRLGAVAGIAALMIWQAEGVLFTGLLRRPDVMLLWVGLLVALLFSRRAVRWLASRRSPAERCLLIGTLSAAERLDRALEGAGQPARIVNCVSPAHLTDLAAPRQPAVDATALIELVERLDVDRVIIADEATDTATTLELLRISRSLDVRMSFLPTVLGALGPAVEFDDVQGLPLIGVQRFGLTRGERIAKRCLDIAVATCGLILVGPLIAIIALAIKLDSPGSVFFRQVRIGRNERSFRIFKFRTMISDAEQRKAELLTLNEAQGLFKMAADPRVTRFGRFLRRTSLDEVPQLINVVRGEMSLVGPRPLVVDEDAQIQGWDRRRLLLTPGMTGHWQILGSARVPLQDMVKIDYRYVAGWTLWEDLKILLRTVPYVLARRGM